MNKQLKNSLAILVILVIGTIALIFGIKAVDRGAQKLPPFIETTAVTEPETTTWVIPVIEYEPEEADEVLNRLREEDVVRAKARATYVSRVEAGTNESNRYYIAAAVCRECGGEKDFDILMLVASVIMNRVDSPHFPNSVYGVLTQKYQYGTLWRDGISFPRWATELIKARCYEAADRVLSGERACPPNVVFQAEFTQGSGVYAAYPGYYFCYE